MTFSDAAGHTVTKALTATGSAQAVSLTSAEVAGLVDGTISVVAVATDAAGNASTNGLTSFVLDTQAPAVAIPSGALTNNAAPVISGTAEAGATVSVDVAGATYVTTATSGGLWSVDTAANPSSGTLTLDVNGTNSVSVTATDAAGNTSSAVTQSLVIDTTAPSLTIGTVATANVVTVTEYGQNLAITGTTVGVADGRTVTLTLNGLSYTGTVTNNAWSVTVPSAAVAQLRDTLSYNIVANVSDAAGNAALTATQSVGVNLSLTGNAATLAAYSNAVLANATNITVTGTTTNVTDLQKILSAGNTGQTVVNTASLTAAQAAGLTLGSNDKILSLAVTGNATVAQAVTIDGLEAAGRVGHATYSVSDTAANIFVADATTQANNLSAINHAVNVTVDGTTALTAAQANTLFAASNTGTTTLDTVSANVGEAAALALGSNDVLTNLNVTVGAQGPAIVNLTNIPFTTNITVDGSAGMVAETIYAPTPTLANITSGSAVANTTAGTAVAGSLNLTGGSGNDVFVVSDTTVNGLPIVTQYPSGTIAGGAGTDKLIVVGTVDISGLTLASVETLIALPGSPSNVTLSAAQLAQFSTIQGSSGLVNGQTTAITTVTIKDLTGAGQISSVSLGGKTITNVQNLYVGVNTEVRVPIAAINSLGVVQTGIASVPGDSNGKVTPVFPSGVLTLADVDGSGNLDLSAYTFSLDLAAALPGLKVDSATGTLVDTNSTGPGSPYHVILPTLAGGQSITLLASQLGIWSGSSGNIPFNLGGTGKLAIKNDLSNPADLANLDLQGVGVSVEKVLTLTVDSDLSALSSLVQSLDEIQLNGNSLTVSVNDVNGTPIGGAGNITVNGTVSGAGPIDLSSLVVAATYTIDLRGISGSIVLPSTVATGSTLKLVDGQFVKANPTDNPQAIANSGTITIYAAGIGSLGSPAAPDFSGITGQGTRTYDVDHNTVLGSGANLAGVAVTIESGKTLTIDAGAGTGLSYDGPASGTGGTLIVTGQLAAAADYSNLGTHLATINLSGIDLNGEALTLPGTVAAGQTLIVSENQAAGATLASAGTLSITQSAAATNGTLDLSAITTTGSGTATFVVSTDSSYSSLQLGAVQASVASNKTLTLSLNDASGATIGGSGAVVLTGLQDSANVASVDLSHITAASSWQVSSDATFAGDLGATVVTIDAGKTLTTSATTASGKTFADDSGVAGLGTLKLTGTFSSSVNLGSVATNIDLVGATVTGVGSLPTFAGGQTITLDYAQADAIKVASGTMDVGAGTAVIVDINSKADADLSAISATGGGTVIAEVANTKTFTGDFGDAEVKLLNGQVVLTVAAGKVSSRTVYTGTAGGTAGLLILTGDGGNTTLASSVVLSGISPSFDLTAITGLTVDASSFKLSDGVSTITMGTLANGQTVWVAAAQLTGGALALSGNAGSTLDVTGDLSGNVNLGGVDDAVTVSFKDTAGDASPAINIGSNVLTAKAQQLNGQTINSDAGVTGTVVVLDNASNKLGGNVNLTGVKADIDLTQLQGLTVGANHKFGDSSGSITLGSLLANQNVKVNAAELAGSLTLSGAAGSSLQVVGNFAASANLTNVADTVTVRFDNDNTNSNPLQITNSATLTAKALQISGMTITSTVSNGQYTGTLAVADNGATGKLSTLTDLTNVAANIDLASLQGVSVNNAADLGYLTDGTGLVLLPVLSSNQSLTITAAQAHGATFDTGGGVMRNAGLVLRGSGTLVLTGDLTAGNVDLTGLPTTISVAINGMNVVGADLVLTAAQANQNTITSDSTGRVVIQGIAATPALTVAALHTSLQTATLPVTSNVTDTAAAIAGATLSELQQILPAYGKITVKDTASVAQATTFAAWQGLAQNPVSVIYSIRDSAAALAASSDAVLGLATSVTASGTANITQAIALDALTTPVTYAVSTTAASVAAAVAAQGSSAQIVDDALAHATSVTLTGTVSFADAATLTSLSNVRSFAIQDTAANLSTLLAGNGGTTTFLAKASSLTVSGGLSTADAHTLLSSASLPSGLPIQIDRISDTRQNFEATYGIADNLPNGVLGLAITGALTVATAPASGSIVNLSDTAANIVGASVNLLSRVTGIVTITDSATVGQAQTLALRSINNNVNGVNIVYSVKDSSAAIAGLLSSNYENLAQFMKASFYANDVANAVNGARIAQLATKYSSAVPKFNFSVSDTADNLIANFSTALLNKVTGSVTVTGTVTAAQAVQLLTTFAGVAAGRMPSYSISDTAANIEAAFQSSGANFLNKATNITVTDTATYTQALHITQNITNSGTTTIAGLTDTSANIALAASSILPKVTGTVTATSTAAEDLSNITGNIDLTGMTGLGTDGSGNIRMSGVSSRDGNTSTVTTYTVTLPSSLASGRTLYVSAAQVAGNVGITLGGSGKVNISGNVTSGIDLRGLATGIQVAFVDSGEAGALGAAAIAAGQTLKLYGNQVTGQTLSGTGTVEIHGRGTSGQLEVFSEVNGTVDIRGISANIDLTKLDLSVNAQGILTDGTVALLSSGTNGALVLQGGQTVSLTQTELFGSNQLAVSGNGVIGIRGDIDRSLDLTYLVSVSGVTLSFLDPGESGTYGRVDVSGTAQSPITLTLAATQASNQMITGSNSTIYVPYRSGASSASTNVSASTNLAQVASTLWKSSTELANLISTATGGWSKSGSGTVSINAAGQVVLSNAASGSNAYFSFTAPKTGIFTFTYTYQSNNFGSNNTALVNYSALDGTAIYASNNGNYYDFIGVRSSWELNTWTNTRGNGVGTGSLAVSLAAGQTVEFYLNNGSNRTDGSTGWMTSASNITITSTTYTGGFSAVGGTSQNLQVEVGASTNLSTAGLLNFTPVDEFKLMNSGTVLTMSPIQANARVVTTSDGYGSVLLTSNSNYFVDLTKIAVPVAFESNTLNINNSYTFLTARQANGVVINGGNFYLVGGITAGDSIDLTRVSSSIQYTSTVSATNTNTIALGAGSSLILTPGQVNGRTVSNVSNSTPGTVYVVGDLGSGGSLDLRNVTANLSFYDGAQNAVTTPNGSLLTQGVLVTRTTTETGPLGKIAMGGSAYIYINGSQLSGQTVTGNGSNQIYVYNTVAAGADYSAITASIDLTQATVTRTTDASNSSYYNLAINFPTTWNSDQVLTLTGAQANYLALNDLPAQVLVRQVEGLIDGNGNINADFTRINSANPGTVTLEFSGGYRVITFNGSFGGNQVLLGWGAQVKMTGAQASGVTFDSRNNGNILGAIGITGITGDTDLTRAINTPTITFPGVVGRVNVDLSYAVTGGSSLNGNAVSWVWDSATAGFFKDGSGNKVLLPTFSSSALIVDLRQLTTAYNGSGPIVAPALSGSGTLIIKGPITSSLDVTNLASTFAVRFGSVVDGSNSYLNGYYSDAGNPQQLTTSISAGQTLTLRADQTYGDYYNWNTNRMLITGDGTVVVTSNFATAHVRLMGVTANIDLRQLSGDASTVRLNGNTISYGGQNVIIGQTYNTTGQLVVGQNLYVHSYQIAGTGGLLLSFGGNAATQTHAKLRITGDVDANYFSGTLNLLNVGYGVDVVFNNNAVSLASGKTIQMRLDQASSFAVNGAGGSVVFGTSSGDANAMVNAGSTVDLTAYQASLDFIALSTKGLVINNAGKLSVGSKVVDLPALVSGQTVSLTATEAGGKLLLGTSTGGTLNIQGNLTSALTAIDLTDVADGIAISFLDSADGGSGVIQILSNTLTMKPGQLTGQVITSNGAGAKTGALVLKGGSLAASGTNLSNVGANIDLTQLSNLTVDAASYKLVDGVGSLNLITTQSGQTVKVLASQLTGGAFAIAADVSGGGTLNVQGDVSGTNASVDLSRVADGVLVSFADSTSNNIAVTNGNTLTLKAAAVNGKTITSDGVDATTRNSGTLIVVDNSTGNVTTQALSPAVTSINLGSVTADIDLTRLAGLQYDATSSKFKDAAGTVTLPSLAAYQSLLMTAAELAGAPVIAGAAGSQLKLVTDYNTQAKYINANTDLTGIADGVTVSVVNASGSNETLGINGVYTLTAKASQLTGLSIGGTVSTTQSVSHIDGTIAVKYNTAGALGAATVNLSGVAVNIDLTALNHLGVANNVLTDSGQSGGTITLPSLAYWQTLSVTSEQLAGGALTVSGSSYVNNSVLNRPTLNIQHDIGNDVDLSRVGDAIAISFSNTNVAITGAYTLTAKAQAISGRTIASALDGSTSAFLGTVALADMASASTGSKLGGNVDLRNISANLDLQALTGLIVKLSGAIGDTSGDILINPLVSGQTLTVAASLLTGSALVLTGAANSTNNYLNITGNLATGGTIDLTSVTGVGISFKETANGANSIEVTNNSALKLTAELANGLTVTSNSSGSKTGKVILAGNLVSGSSISLGSVSANIDLRQALNLVVNNSGLFESTSNSGTIAALALVAGQTLSVQATQLTGGALDLSGSSGGVIAVEGTSANNISTIANDIDLSNAGAVALQLDAGAQLSGATLTLGGIQANNLAVTSANNGSVNTGRVAVKGALSGNVDLTATSADIDLTQLSVTADTTANTFIDAGNQTVTIGTLGAIQRLFVTTTQANSLILTGTGTLVLKDVSQGTALAGNVILTNVATGIDLTQLSGLSVDNSGALSASTFAITLPDLLAGQKLTVTAAQLTGGALVLNAAQGVTTSTLAIATDIGNGVTVDLSAVDNAIGLSFTSATPVIDGTLILSTDQASGKTLTGQGTIRANVVTATPATFDLSNVATASAVVDVKTDAQIDSSSNLGIASVSVQAGATLTVDASVLSGHGVAGAGTLKLTGSNVGSADLRGIFNGVSGQIIATVDLRDVTPGADNGMIGTQSIFVPVSGQTYAKATVANNQTFVLTAGQLSGHAIAADGVNGTGVAQVHVATSHIGDAYDFSHVTTFSGLSLIFDEAGTLNSSTQGISNFASVILYTGTTTLNATQANGVQWSGSSLGGVEITAISHSSAYSLYGTTFGDIIGGSGRNDSVNISQGGIDTLKFSGTGSDFTVNGFSVGDIAALNSDADKLDFTSLNGGQSFGFSHLDLSNLPGSIGDHQVVVIDNFAAADANAVQALFASSVFRLNNKLISGAANDAIFVIHNGGANGTEAANIWRWVDSPSGAGADYRVQANELTLMGKLNGLTIDDGSGNPLLPNDLSYLHVSQVIG